MPDDNQSAGAIQESEVQNVIAKKSNGRMRKDAVTASALSFHVKLRATPDAVPSHLFDHVVE